MLVGLRRSLARSGAGIWRSAAGSGGKFPGDVQSERLPGERLATEWRTVCNPWCSFAVSFAGGHGVQRTRDLTKYEPRE
jgi:hypothetical protein